VSKAKPGPRAKASALLDDVPPRLKVFPSSIITCSRRTTALTTRPARTAGASDHPWSPALRAAMPAQKARDNASSQMIARIC
jgi:hypothetical protein